MREEIRAGTLKKIKLIMPLISILRDLASLVRAAHLTIAQVHLEFSGSCDRWDLLVFTCLFTCMATDRGPPKTQVSGWSN